MTKQEKNDVIEVLKGKFSQYNNFYITDTESLTVAQVTTLRGHCFNKQVEMKVAKNTLIKKALESLDAEKYAGVYESKNELIGEVIGLLQSPIQRVLGALQNKDAGKAPEATAAVEAAPVAEAKVEAAPVAEAPAAPAAEAPAADATPAAE
jgi:large subunit ribosomal protein L10